MPTAAAPTPVAAAPAAPTAPTAPPPPATVTDGIETVRGQRLTLHFEAARCIHSRHCVLSTPEVFLANVKGDWIYPDAVPIDEVTAVAHACPSGAITYERHDDEPGEQVPRVNALRLRENGPLAITADLRVAGRPAAIRATLCRCGASQHKPYCDGSHNAAEFRATGEPATGDTTPLAARGGPLSVEAMENGPLLVTGNLEICAGTGRTITRVTSARLCRCGGSSTKPLCDGTHAKNGFRAPAVG
ncbi:MAG: CDGSH iron-sulfur domain-containing protein [Kofleriaceae bacterium]